MPPRSEKEELAARRSRRNEFYDNGVTPSGDRRLNPEKKRTAHEYDSWRRTQPSHHMDEGAFLGNLEQEERSSGNWSYPAGHPRRVALEAGKDPDYEDLRASGSFNRRPEASSSPQEPPGSQNPSTGTSRASKPPKVSAATRTNRWETPCSSCGEPVYPGEGKVEKDLLSGQWSTTHLNER